MQRECFGKADWEKFRINCEELAHLVTLEGSIEQCTRYRKDLNATNVSIPKEEHTLGGKLCLGGMRIVAEL